MPYDSATPRRAAAALVASVLATSIFSPVTGAAALSSAGLPAGSRAQVGQADADNRPPTADPFVGDTKENRTGAAPFEAHFEAAATDPDGDPLTYAWDFGFADDNSDKSTLSHAHHTYTVRGRYPVTLEVSDGRGGVFRAEYLLTVTGGEEPLATASGSPTTGQAPVTVVFYGGGEDEQSTDLDFSWDFGVPGVPAADSRRASHTYTAPGTYTATLTVTDPDGNTGTDTVEIVVTNGQPDPDPDPDPEPEPAPELSVDVTADPSTGAAPLPVSFETTVSNPSTTGGELTAFADGLTSYPDLRGTAEMVRGTGSTTASLQVTGLKPSAMHMVHVHEQACGVANAGPHFRFDETQPYSEANEIWLPFTSNADGTSGAVSVTKARRAGPKAVSLVIHDPDNPAKRIGCVDFAPTELDYVWDFGDGTTGTGAAPEHTYTEAGTYRATVAVTDHGAGHGERRRHGDPVTASVEVTVTGGDTTAPQTRVASGPSGTVRTRTATFALAADEAGTTFECSLDWAAYRSCAARVSWRDLGDGIHRLRVRGTDAAGNRDATPASRAWRVDTRGPWVRGAGPTASTRDRTPTLRATISDAGGQLTRRHLDLRVDGKVASWVHYDVRRGLMTWTPQRGLAPGRHSVRLVAVDKVGNRTVTQWGFTIRR